MKRLLWAGQTIDSQMMEENKFGGKREKEFKLPAAFRELRWYEIIYSSLQNVLLPPRESKRAELELLTLLSYKFFEMQLTKLLIVCVRFPKYTLTAQTGRCYEEPQFIVTDH